MTDITTPFPLINAVLQKLQEGTVFSIADDKAFLILHKAGFGYLINDTKGQYEDVVKFLIESKDIPEYFHIYDAEPGLLEACSKHIKSINIKIRQRVQLRYSRNSRVNVKEIPNSYSVKRISEENFNSLSIFNLLVDSKFWKSKADFLNNGFGFIVNNSLGKPVSICYTASVSNDVAEIDVATLPLFQRKGLALRVVTEFVNHCYESKIHANWDCFEDNTASLNTALSIGFAAIKNYSFLSIFNKERKNEIN